MQFLVVEVAVKLPLVATLRTPKLGFLYSPILLLSLNVSIIAIVSMHDPPAMLIFLPR